MAGQPASIPADISDELAYLHDGSPEGLLSCIFAAYERHEDPAEIACRADHQPRLLQTSVIIPTDPDHAHRVLAGIRTRLGAYTHRQALKCTLSGRADAGTALYRFVRFALDGTDRRHCESCRFQDRCARRSCQRMRMAPVNDVTHPRVKPFHDAVRSVDNECEKIRQFARFQHLRDEDRDIWFARINPKDSVVPLVLEHFVERFSIQPFILYDEVHALAGIWNGRESYLVDADDDALTLPGASATEAVMQDAWKAFYRTLSIDARYNPELRRQHMPKRFWKNLTEMQGIATALQRPHERPIEEVPGF